MRFLLPFLILQQAIPAFAGLRGDDIVPNAFIVKFKNSGQSVSGNDHTASIDDSVHTAFESFLGQASVDFKTNFKFTDKALFHGYSVNLANAADVAALHSFGETDAVYPVRRIKLTHSKRAVSINARTSVQSQNSDSAAPVTVPATNMSSGPIPDTFSPHLMTGVDKLHAQNHFGNSAIVGVIDSGIDHHHDALNQHRGYGNTCFGQKGCPIVGGRSFLNDASNSSISNDPQIHCPATGDAGHGTHTAGTIVASPRDRNCPGVIPTGQVYAYRVFGCDGGGQDDVLMAAMQQAVHDKVDIISMSIGGPGIFSYGEPSGELATSIMRNTGIPVVISAGNDGNSGLFMPSSPGGARDVIGVGSINNNMRFGFTAKITFNGGSKDIVYMTGNEWALNGTKTWPVYVTSKIPNVESDGCDDLPDDTPDLSKYVVVMARGVCGLDKKTDSAHKKGAKLILFYNNPGKAPGTSDGKYWPSPRSAMLSWEDGMAITGQIAKGPVTIDFTASKAIAVEDTLTGGNPSDFSQYGPTMDLRIPTSVSGVGTQILSTFPVNAGRYVTLIGTSMSCPQVAGITALFQTIKGKSETPLQIRSVLTTTATPVAYNRSLNVLDSVARQGGGLVNAFKAVNTPTRVWPDRIELNDTAYFNGTQTLTITNVGKEEQKFMTSHLPAGTVYTFDNSNKFIINEFPLVPVNEDQAQLTFSPTSFTLAPGKSQAVVVTVKAPAPSQSTLPVFSGYAQFQSNLEMGTLTVPYLGVAGSMHEIPVFNTTLNNDGNRTPLFIDSNNTVIKDDNFTYVITSDDTPPGVALNFTITVGSARVTLELVYANTTFVPTIPSATVTKTTTAPQPLRKEERVGILDDEPISRGMIDGGVITASFGPSWDDDKDQKHNVTSGHYRLLVRGQKLFTLGDKEVDFESWLSPAFYVKRT
ncbi:hypothetical protein A4X09_0g4014 [Tilletia walkeri]|uniref:Minor extracellular protease vpr n=1 Tax=Tilletia walkeri TaxID=117179 RepID=A0A8X7NA82_9BASI|nr:hypothetical protein A4X09_0g4014 [Tilletia walkeri]